MTKVVATLENDRAELLEIKIEKSIADECGYIQYRGNIYKWIGDGAGARYIQIKLPAIVG